MSATTLQTFYGSDVFNTFFFENIEKNFVHYDTAATQQNYISPFSLRNSKVS